MAQRGKAGKAGAGNDNFVCFAVDGDAIVDGTQAEREAMIRNAFKMKLKPGNIDEYKRRHDQIWPELALELQAAGVSDYSIFLDEETLTLFAVQKLAQGNTASQLPAAPIVRKWWDYMAPLMEVHPDNSPVCKPLKEVFHLL